MIRVIDCTLVALALGGAVWTYQIKHSAEQSAKKISSLTREIDAQENKITLLRADWAIMTSPERLTKVAKDYEGDLGLAEMQSEQIVTLDELPPLRPTSNDNILQALEKDGAASKATGSVTIPTRRRPVRD